jgi:PAS domain S-box-containing protein
MISREAARIDALEYSPAVDEPIPVSNRAADGNDRVELSPQERAELLDVMAWGSMLEMYGNTMKVAVALTDVDGNLLGRCLNPQPIWTLVQSAVVGRGTGCPFCLAPLSPCTAVADALRTGLPVIVRDLADLTHVAIPLSLGEHRLGAILAGQVPDRYPESLVLQRAAKVFGVPAQILWRLSSKQQPVSRGALRLAGDLLSTLGNAFLRQRYSTILEARVAQSNLRFRLLVEGVTGYALFTTNGLGLVTSWNSGAERMLGYREAGIVGRQFSCMFAFEDFQNGVPGRQLLKASQEGHTEDEGWRVREDGTQFWANAIITRKKDDCDRGFIVVMQDITEKRKAAVELESVRRERMNLQEQFLAHVSHELRTPLTALYFFITNLLDGVVGDLTSAQREHLEFSVANVQQLKDMVGDLVDVSRIETLKLTVDPQHTSVSILIAEALRTCQASAELKGINLLAEIAPSLPCAWADSSRVLQVLVNLISNAIKFTSNNRAVTIAGRVLAEDTRFLCLSVADTGCGISPDDCSMIFDRLSQVGSAESSRKGLGLGLFISRELVLQQGGRIWVVSQLGRGSTFYFTLPVFSLPKSCRSILTPANLAAGCVALISIDLPTIDGSGEAQGLAGIRKALESCILADRDLLLPSMTDAGTGETFFIVACTEANGAEAMTGRLRKLLESLKLNPVIAATLLQISSNDRSWEERIAQLTNRIDSIVQTRLLERKNLK